jgi:hypothetical protein
MEDDTLVAPQWEVAKHDLSWRWVPSTALGLAAEDLAISIATEDDCFNTELTDEELARALRQLASIASVVCDLAQLWGVRAPSLVEEALS